MNIHTMHGVAYSTVFGGEEVSYHNNLLSYGGEDFFTAILGGMQRGGNDIGQSDETVNDISDYISDTDSLSDSSSCSCADEDDLDDDQNDNSVDESPFMDSESSQEDSPLFESMSDSLDMPNGEEQSRLIVSPPFTKKKKGGETIKELRYEDLFQDEQSDQLFVHDEQTVTSEASETGEVNEVSDLDEDETSNFIADTGDVTIQQVQNIIGGILQKF